jgi:hypothetical protein
MIAHAETHDVDQPMAGRGNSAGDHAGNMSDGALIAAIARGDQ